MARRTAWLLFLSLLGALGLAGCGGSNEEAGPDGAAAPDPARTVQLLFTYGSEKEEWIKEVTARFNEAGQTTASGKAILVEAVPQGSGEAIDDILAGVRQAHLTSPASAAFIKLGNAASRAKTGNDLVGPTRNLVLSPVVIAMWRPMAEAIGWGKKPIGWGEILELARDSRGWAAHGHPEWGAFKLGHTHPDYSNSGLISLLAEVYAASGKMAALTLDDVRDPKTAAYVAGIESSIVHYGSSTGFFGKRLFTDGPGYLSAAVLYENMVIESYGPQYRLPFPVVAVYPREGTFWSDHPVGIVEREWVTPEHREAAEAYISYLLARPQQEAALRFGFRPSDVAIALVSPFDAAHGVDPREPQTTLEVPPVEVIEAVRTLWRAHKKRSDITLVLDISGSMREDDKMENAKAGAEQLLQLLDPQDTFSFLPFNAEPAWAGQDLRLADARDATVEKVRGLFADGGTALYDAIAMAHTWAAPRSGKGRISAIVVLSDGKDTDSTSIQLPELLQRLRGSGEAQGVRVFTIAYGEGAETDVLEQLAEATRGRSYVGTPENIRTVFREISTFF